MSPLRVLMLNCANNSKELILTRKMNHLMLSIWQWSITKCMLQRILWQEVIKISWTPFYLICQWIAWVGEAYIIRKSLNKPCTDNVVKNLPDEKVVNLVSENALSKITIVRKINHITGDIGEILNRHLSCTHFTLQTIEVSDITG